MTQRSTRRKGVGTQVGQLLKTGGHLAIIVIVHVLHRHILRLQIYHPPPEPPTSISYSKSSSISLCYILPHLLLLLLYFLFHFLLYFLHVDFDPVAVKFLLVHACGGVNGLFLRPEGDTAKA
ncbi:hypothetical protein EDD21DRAFT_16586 [Dissophora ornata]|nr:hypothetical protein EDD21DRAFT_16586 [Dissophora ornata]